MFSGSVPRDCFATAVRIACKTLQDPGHRHATPGLRVGLHPNVVSDRLGRANTAITLGTPSDAMSAMLVEAASRIAALVFAGNRICHGLTQRVHASSALRSAP